MRRLDAVSRSPVFAWFSETLSGLSTIRAYGQQEVFQANSLRRLDRNQMCYYASISVNRWLTVRLEFVGNLLVLLVAVLSMVELISGGIDSGLVGVVLSSTMIATQAMVSLLSTTWNSCGSLTHDTELGCAICQRVGAKLCQCGTCFAPNGSCTRSPIGDTRCFSRSRVAQKRCLGVQVTSRSCTIPVLHFLL